MNNEQFLALLEKRITMFEKNVERKSKRLEGASSLEVTLDVYEDIAQMGINYINDIKIDYMRLKAITEQS